MVIILLIDKCLQKLEVYKCLQSSTKEVSNAVVQKYDKVALKQTETLIEAHCFDVKPYYALI